MICGVLSVLWRLAMVWFPYAAGGALSTNAMSLLLGYNNRDLALSHLFTIATGSPKHVSTFSNSFFKYTAQPPSRIKRANVKLPPRLHLTKHPVRLP